MAASERWARETERLYDPAWPTASRWQLLAARSELAYFSHRYDELEAVLDECLSLGTTLGDQELMRTALGNLMVAASARGDFALAVARGRALGTLLRHDRVETITVHFFVNFGAALTEFGELDEALSVLREAAPMLTRQGMWWMSLDAIALLAFKRGRIRDSALALGRSDALFVKLNRQRDDPVAQRMHDAVLSGLQQALPAADLERLLAEGAAMSDEEAARGALAD